MKKKALITGITGQDGSYLTELLLSKDYEVHGIIRRSSSFNTSRIDHVYQDRHEKNVNLFLHYGDLTDSSNLNRLMEKIVPDEIYNLAAQSHVRVSFDVPEYTAEVDAIGTLRLLDAVKENGLKSRFYQASTSELFGKVLEMPQSEKTPFNPCSPYAVAKQYAFWITKNYRDAYGVHASNGILFNHESPRRGETFVTRKITMAVARIVNNMAECMYLGNLNACRDWGYAVDYVRMMHLMLQQDTPDDYVAATGEMHSIREFVCAAFECAGRQIEFQGDGVDEVGIDLSTNKVVVRVDPQYYRPNEVEVLLGDASKAKRVLGWEPTVKFKELVEIMTKADFELLHNPKYRWGF